MLADRLNGAELEKKWLEAAGAETLAELTQEQAGKSLAFLTGRKELVKA